MNNINKLPTYGGQAVIEGVMMRGSTTVAVAMRSPEHEIVIHTEQLGGIYKSNLSKIPFLRGLVLLWDALGLGMRALTLSANLQTGEDEDLEGAALYITLGLSLAFGIGLFFMAPATVGQWIEIYFSVNAWWGNLTEGIMRLILLVGYVWAIGFMPDIKRVYAYHGAEHKTINAFEDGAELTPETVAKYPLEHPRCGTAFLLNVVIISIILFTMMGPMSLFWRLVSRILLLPVISGIAYEYLRWTANHLSSPFVRWIIKPNLALQRLTTNEPDLDVIEVGIAAFNAMLEQENQLIT